MAIGPPAWFFTPLQVLFVTVAGMNAGASALQSPLTWPLLQDEQFPAHIEGLQTEKLLHGSEHLFPPFNAVGTLGNLVLTGFIYFDKRHGGAEAKLPWCATAFGLHVLTTVYTLGIQARYNEKLKVASKEMNREPEKSPGYDSAVKNFREAQGTWKTLNYGRGVIMAAATVANAIALIS